MMGGEDALLGHRQTVAEAVAEMDSLGGWEMDSGGSAQLILGPREWWPKRCDTMQHSSKHSLTMPHALSAGSHSLHQSSPVFTSSADSADCSTRWCPGGLQHQASAAFPRCIPTSSSPPRGRGHLRCGPRLGPSPRGRLLAQVESAPAWGSSDFREKRARRRRRRRSPRLGLTPLGPGASL